MSAKSDLVNAIVRNVKSDWDVSGYAYEAKDICDKLFADATVRKCAPRDYVIRDADGKIVECAFTFDVLSPGGSLSDYISSAALRALASGYEVTFPDVANWGYAAELSARIDETALSPEYMHEEYGI